MKNLKKEKPKVAKEKEKKEIPKLLKKEAEGKEKKVIPKLLKEKFEGTKKNETKKNLSKEKSQDINTKTGCSFKTKMIIFFGVFGLAATVSVSTGVGLYLAARAKTLKPIEPKVKKNQKIENPMFKPIVKKGVTYDKKNSYKKRPAPSKKIGSNKNQVVFLIEKLQKYYGYIEFKKIKSNKSKPTKLSAKQSVQAKATKQTVVLTTLKTNNSSSANTTSTTKGTQSSFKLTLF